MNFERLFNSQTKSITFAALLIGISTLISRVLGLLRDRLLATKFGAGETLDVYFAAFRIPDFVFGILILGGISAAFLPVFSEYFHKDKKQAWQLTNNVLNSFLILLILICGLLVIFTPQLIKIITPGFSPENKVLTIAMTRIMFLSPILFGLSSIFSGILQYFHRFLVYSLAPILYNLGIIFGILFFVPIFNIFGLAYGVILGAFLHLIIQVPAVINSGFKYKAIFNLKMPGLKKMFKLIIPRTISQASYHFNLVVITAIASTLTVGSIAVFNFSNNLQYFPIGLIGISFAVASFPVLSKTWARGNKKEFLEKFSATFRKILFFVIPVSVLIFLLRAQLVRIILGAGKFGWWETRLTAASLGLFCLGIFGTSLIPLISRAFFSFQDTKTPTIISVIAMVLNIIFAFLLVWLLGSSNIFQQIVIGFLKLKSISDIRVIGLPLALSLASIFQFSLLLIILRKKLADLWLGKEIRFSLKKIIIASFLMGIFTYLLLQIIAPFTNMQKFWGVFSQTVIAGLFGVAIYLLLTHSLGCPEIKSIKYSVLKKFKKNKNRAKRK